MDNTLSTDASNVSIANLTIRPEFRVPLDGLAIADSRSVFSFAPRGICERVEAGTVSQSCGGGLEVGLSRNSDDGLTNLNARILADRVGGSTRTGVEFGLQHRF